LGERSTASSTAEGEFGLPVIEPGAPSSGGVRYKACGWANGQRMVCSDPSEATESKGEARQAVVRG